jgi:hypothetical protein
LLFGVSIIFAGFLPLLGIKKPLESKPLLAQRPVQITSFIWEGLTVLLNIARTVIALFVRRFILGQIPVWMLTIKWLMGADAIGLRYIYPMRHLEVKNDILMISCRGQAYYRYFKPGAPIAYQGYKSRRFASSPKYNAEPDLERKVSVTAEQSKGYRLSFRLKSVWENITCAS